MRVIQMILILLFMTSCESNKSVLFKEVISLANLEGYKEPILIQKGKESGFIKPLMTYEISTLDSMTFKKLHAEILQNEKFEQGRYYLNFELDDFIGIHKLKIMNMSKSLIYENKYDNIYNIYLFSDNNTIAICKINT